MGTFFVLICSTYFIQFIVTIHQNTIVHAIELLKYDVEALYGYLAYMHGAYSLIVMKFKLGFFHVDGHCIYSKIELDMVMETLDNCISYTFDHIQDINDTKRMFEDKRFQFDNIGVFLRAVILVLVNGMRFDAWSLFSLFLQQFGVDLLFAMTKKARLGLGNSMTSVDIAVASKNYTDTEGTVRYVMNIEGSKEMIEEYRGLLERVAGEALEIQERHSNLIKPALGLLSNGSGSGVVLNVGADPVASVDVLGVLSDFGQFC